jgi:hypothetical protein
MAHTPPLSVAVTTTCAVRNVRCGFSQRPSASKGNHMRAENMLFNPFRSKNNFHAFVDIFSEKRLETEAGQRVQIKGTMCTEKTVIFLQSKRRWFPTPI